MIIQTAAGEKTGTSERSSVDSGAHAPGFASLLILAVWCGMACGLLEVGTIIVHKRAFDTNQLYGMSRHFVWLIPMTNIIVFLVLGLLGCLVSWAWPTRGRWVFGRVLCALTFLPIVLVAAPRVYSLAWMVVALGVAARLVPLVGKHAAGFRRLVRMSFSPIDRRGGGLGHISLGWRLAQAIKRASGSVAAGGISKRHSGGTGHGRGRSPESFGLPATDQPDASRARRARHTF